MCPSRNQVPVFANTTDDLLWRPWERNDAAGAQSQIPHPQPLTTTCKMCGAVFKRESELKRHVLSKHSAKREKCKECNKVFTRKDNLTRHMKLAHSDLSKPFCRFCKKPLSRKDAVQRHESSCPKSPKKQNVKPPVHTPFPSSVQKEEQVAPQSHSVDPSQCQSYGEYLRRKLEKSKLTKVEKE